MAQTRLYLMAPARPKKMKKQAPILRGATKKSL
jgi:hypothetical protein